MAQGHGFAGDRQLVFQPGPGETEQGLANRYPAQGGAPGEEGDVAGFGWHQVFRGQQVKAAQQAHECRAEAEVFVAQFGGFPGGV